MAFSKAAAEPAAAEPAAAEPAAAQSVEPPVDVVDVALRSEVGDEGLAGETIKLLLMNPYFYVPWNGWFTKKEVRVLPCYTRTHCPVTCACAAFCYMHPLPCNMHAHRHVTCMRVRRPVTCTRCPAIHRFELSSSTLAYNMARLPSRRSVASRASSSRTRRTMKLPQSRFSSRTAARTLPVLSGPPQVPGEGAFEAIPQGAAGLRSDRPPHPWHRA